MDKLEIKKMLKAQIEPMDQAVDKKLAYLKSDDVFTAPDEPVLNNDNSLWEAFSGEISKPSVPMFNQPSPRELYQSIQSALQPKYVEEKPTQSTIEQHKQNIAAKIAALRGISMPGDYLRNRK